jgi:hypothetical protein
VADDTVPDLHDLDLSFVHVTLDHDQYDALWRSFADRAELANWLGERVRGAVKHQLKKEAYARADAAGQLYVARYWQDGTLKEERFLTPQEAVDFDFLESGVEEGSLKPVGVFGPDGTEVEDWR